MSNLEIIPFGKYKGKPVDVLRQDQEYVKWLKTQDWFNLRYQNINTLIINNFGEPSETPEHNKIQALFIDEDFCYKLLNFMLDKELLRRTYSDIVEIDNPKFKYPSIPSLEDLKNKNFISEKPEPKRIKIKQEFDYNFKLKCIEFERNSVDVMINFTDALLWIEIKPHLSDDYPSVLRQMMSNKSNVLLIGSFGAKGATIEQVIQIFFKSRIRVLLLSDFHTLNT